VRSSSSRRRSSLTPMGSVLPGVDGRSLRSQNESRTFEPQHLIGSHALDVQAEASVWNLDLLLGRRRHLVCHYHVTRRFGLSDEVVVGDLKEPTDGGGLVSLVGCPLTDASQGGQ